ncbi:uncharacterized protein [Neodiprion pinetum]|uniref:Uncharacterized protein LOC107225618 n=1 Tax=Neodiprion lecontei TaxID=441921 RepID=A0A6J0C5H8_NEOLC|nr:uncharacterized protein LOC107225618 [Neodiprion lecontei]XP_046474827.1 uncharacterized protein LOC124215457 [Neodiprion pinetum]
MGSSSQPDRSLGGGLSLPQWMKNKMDVRFDFDESAFSPPSYDDSFFYVRYPKKEEKKPAEEGFTAISQVLNENKTITAATQVTSSQPQPPDFKEVKEIDFSKHPLPCQPFIPNAAQKEPKPPKSTYVGKVKSQGIDDGFHGQSALCGKSIVHVANQMMSGKVTKGFSIETNQIQESAQCSSRKESKSLPATPLTSPASTPDNSPKQRRKLMQSNRFFTGAYLPDKEKYQGGWILASILGQQRETVVTKIEEEDESEDVASPILRNLNRKKSISSQNLTYIPKTDTAAPSSNKNVYTNVFQAKPSELREMNFWSPTSM